MSKLSRLIQPFQRVVNALFVRDVTLRRDETGLHVTLAERMPEAAAKAAPVLNAAQERQRAETALILTQLSEVLDELPETRETLRHLVFVEHSISRKGLRALKKMPLDVLKRGLDQFEGLVTNWSPEGLANLRSKMAVVVMERETYPGTTEFDGLDSMFAPDRVEAVLDPPKVQAARAIEAARRADFEDSTIERMALQFGVSTAGARARVPDLEMQGELDSPSAKALVRGPGGGGGRAGAETVSGDISLRTLRS